MSMSDPLADMLTRIRNAGMEKFSHVEIPLSNIKKGISDILKNEGYINDYQIIDDNKQGTIRINLKYDRQQVRVITGLKRISKPGRRIYCKSDEIPKVLNGLGIGILSTSKGIMTDLQARNNKIGGELLCEVW
jgi:small subunit ribosomal protein S8